MARVDTRDFRVCFTLWVAVRFGSAQVEMAWGVASDVDGNVYVVGQSTGNIPGAGTSFPNGTTSMFLAKYASDGKQVWVRQLGVNNRTTVGRGVAISGEHVYVTGFTSIALDGQPFVGGSSDAFIVHYDRSGARITAETRLIGTTALDQAYSILAAGEAGSLYDEQGAGTFIYTRDANPGGFEVQIRQCPLNTQVAGIQAVGMRIGRIAWSSTRRRRGCTSTGSRPR